MNIKTFSFIMICMLLMGSCKTAKQTANTPSLPEMPPKAEITVRTESVKLVELTDRAMYRYYVIVGSFRNIDGARQYSADMVKKGFTTEILENEDGLYRISAGGYDEENVARTRISGIRAAYKEHEDVWLLVRK